jgi:flagellar basal-body rod modification protein FlgD
MYVTNPLVGAASMQTNAASNPARPSQSLDTTFAQLLVAQLKSQDPLNPMDPTQFVSQITDRSKGKNRQRTRFLEIWV